MPRLPQFLDRVIDAGILAVLIFTPLAFGAVEPWARSIGQILILTIFTAWIVKVIWAPARVARHSRSGVFGGRVQLSGLEWPGLFFAAVVFLQIIPLPPGLVKAVSPKTAEFFAASLPSYGQAGDGSFAGLPQWLEEEAQPSAGGVPVLPPDPGGAAASGAMPLNWFAEDYSAWRPLSLTPAHTRRALGVFLAHLAFFVVVFNRIERRTVLERYLVVVAGLVGLLSTLGIFQYLTSDNKLYWWRGGGKTSFGPFANANNFAGWMEMALPIAAGLVVMLWRKRHRRGSRAPAGVLLFGFITIVGMSAFVLAKSRGGFLALLGSLVIVLIIHTFTRRLRPGTIAVMLVPVLLAFAMAAWIGGEQLRDRYGTLADVQEERSFVDRLAFSRVTLDMAADFPVLGTGLGTFREAYYLYTPGTAKSELARAHNDYAQLASESGGLGVLAMLWALGLLLSRGVIGGLVRRQRSSTWYVQPAVIGVLALLLHSFVSFNWQIYSNGMLFVFLCGVLMRCRTDAMAGAGRRS